jgi:hypothetical protein
MKIIGNYKEPQDIFCKLLREGHRTWHSENEQARYDHFCNFCVTSHSMRDWCIKYLDLSNPQPFHDDMNLKMYHPECRDIANSTKHFCLKDRISKVNSTSTVESEFIVLSSGKTGESYEKITRKVIIIELENGTNVELFEFLFKVSNAWMDTFNKYEIPLNSDQRPEYMFASIV